MRIVRLANFVTEHSGGLRTALRHLGAGYRAAGHDTVLVIPGTRDTETTTEQGRVITLRAPVVPATGGYRVLLDRPKIELLLGHLQPDRVEVSDRTTLRWIGGWARRHGVPSMMVSHESLDGLLRMFVGPSGVARRIADTMNARTAADYDQVVCTTSWAAAEFQRLGATNTLQVPLGVDLCHFHPDRHDSQLRARYARAHETLILHCGRLSAEKRPQRSLDALAALRAAGMPAVLVVAGDGPRLAGLRASAERRGLPVHFLGHVAERGRLAALLATADIVLAPGPVETFGLAALEALASGTPVVASARSALPQVLGRAGLAAADNGPAFADAVIELAARPPALRRRTAREQAERFPWSAAVSGFLHAHRATTHTGSPPRPGH